MKEKYKLLVTGMFLDGIGMLSFVIPFIGEFFDIFWAPLASFIILKMYKGTAGKVASLVTFVEEIGIFGTDFIPTFTLTWIYKFLIKKETD